MNDVNPDYVVVGETCLTATKIELAVRLVRQGAKLIGTNPTLPASGTRNCPATKALIALIELATGKKHITLKTKSTDDAARLKVVGHIH